MSPAGDGESPARHLVLVLNERQRRQAVDWYLALDRLVADGRLRGSTVVPYLALLDEGMSPDEVVAQVLATARSEEAGLVLWAHTYGLRVSESAVAGLRGVAPAIAMGYWDGDWYHWYRVPFPSDVRDLCRDVDVAFVVGTGWFDRYLRRAGCPDVRYVPSSTDPRFARQPVRQSYDYDLVMVGNHTPSRLPLKTMPGAVLREHLVRYFTRRLGSRFRVYGRGWSGPSAGGVIPYEAQCEAYAQGAAALGCSNWLTPYYFSDRLPIMMSSGRPVIHHREPGFDEVFGADPGVFWFDDPDGAWRQFRAVMEDPEGARHGAVRAHDLATSRFTTHRVLEYMVSVLDAHADARAAGRPVVPVPNPWIGAERLA